MCNVSYNLGYYLKSLQNHETEDLQLKVWLDKLKNLISDDLVEMLKDVDVTDNRLLLEIALPNLRYDQYKIEEKEHDQKMGEYYQAQKSWSKLKAHWDQYNQYRSEISEQNAQKIQSEIERLQKQLVEMERLRNV